MVVSWNGCEPAWVSGAPPSSSGVSAYPPSSTPKGVGSPLTVIGWLTSAAGYLDARFAFLFAALDADLVLFARARRGLTLTSIVTSKPWNGGERFRLRGAA